ncbi:uncharacterized protein E0L32_011254 [Thyridium curvatum]|uniref:Uncharacterized protein n=1 Tax=Thyridium curvatum TaxID=1093900 RepID=A0A507BHU1_9PEZI|nr:uncharacterized protein E0L32_011254 [Thyridium curvatum]TPX19093.1 hypothetical protein E0L32_011254 [Thyridium curvatum]
MILLFWFICLLGTHLALATHPPVCSGPSPTSPSCEFQALIRDAHGFTLTLTKDKQGQLVGSDVPLNGTFPVPDGDHTLMYLRVDGDGHLRDRDDQWCWAVPPTDTLVCSAFPDDEHDPNFAKLVGPDRWALDDDGRLLLVGDGFLVVGTGTGTANGTKREAAAEAAGVAAAGQRRRRRRRRRRHQSREFVACPTGGPRREVKLYLDSGAQPAGAPCKLVSLTADGCFCGRPAANYTAEHPPPLQVFPLTLLGTSASAATATATSI